MKFIGEKLKHLREVKGLSLSDIEKITGLKPGHISDIENDKRNPRPDTVQKLSEGLKIDQIYFYLEESRLPTDLLPDMPDDVKKFIMQSENTPYLVLTEKAKREGVPPEMLDQILNLFISNRRK